LIPVSSQTDIKPEALRAMLQEIAADDALEIHSVATGYSGSMPDLGSPSFLPLRHRGVMMLAGAGVGSPTAGAVWHHFDQVLRSPLTLVEPTQVTTSVLDDFSTVILADTPVTGLSERARTALQGWVSRGGTLIAIGTSVRSLAALPWCKVDVVGGEARPASETTATNSAAPKTEPAPVAPAKPLTAPKRLPYAEADERRAEKKLDGVIVRATYDATHPLAFGFGSRPFIELLRDGETFLKPASSAYLNPLHYAAEPLVSGYASKSNLDQMKHTTPVQLRVVDAGQVIYMTDNPVFRGHWLGCEKLLANAIFFGPLVKSTGGGAGEDAHEDH
jgi:hypothetical protein